VSQLRVLVACEFSGVVRDAFLAQGHEAVSVDLLPSESDKGHHIQNDIGHVLAREGMLYDLLVAFPPCTHLSASGARWWHRKATEQEAALDFVRMLMAAPIPYIALENPVGRISSAIRKPDQIIQPWQFGHGEVKGTCLWLKGLPPLKPTRVVEGRSPKCWKMPETLDRWKKRSRTYQGIADAMAAQWGAWVQANREQT
jgi:site-specific DNA-cytosine methylase